MIILNTFYFLRIKLILLFLISCSQVLFCQEITLNVNLNKVNELNFELYKFEESLNASKIVTAQSYIKTELKAKVEKHQQNFLLIWEYGNSTPLGESAKALEEFPAEYKEMISLYKGIEVKVLVDSTGKFISVYNKDQIIKSLKLRFSKFIKLPNPDISNTEVNAILEELLMPDMSTEDLLNYYFPEVLFYLKLNGKKLINRSEESSKISVPSFFNMLLIPIQHMSFIRELSGTNIEILLINQLKKKHILTWLNQEKSISDKQEGLASYIKENINNGEFEVNSNITYTYNSTQQLIKKLSFNTYTKFNKETNTQRFDLILK